MNIRYPIYEGVYRILTKIKGYIVIISYICRDEPGLFIFKKER